MGGPRCTPRNHGVPVMLAALAILAVSGCAGDGASPDTTATSEVATTDTTIPVLTPDAIPVLRAVAQIPRGTEARDALDAGLIEPTTVPRDLFPEDGVVTIELIEGRRAVADIAEGTVLSLAMFTQPENATTPAGAGVVSER